MRPGNISGQAASAQASTKAENSDHSYGKALKATRNVSAPNTLIVPPPNASEILRIPGSSAGGLPVTYLALEEGQAHTDAFSMYRAQG